MLEHAWPTAADVFCGAPKRIDRMLHVRFVCPIIVIHAFETIRQAGSVVQVGVACVLSL